MNQMVIKGVDSQTFMAANLGRVENFQGFSGPPGSQTDGTQSQPTSSGYHLQLSKFYLRAAAWSRDLIRGVESDLLHDAGTLQAIEPVAPPGARMNNGVRRMRERIRRQLTNSCRRAELTGIAQQPRRARFLKSRKVARGETLAVATRRWRAGIWPVSIGSASTDTGGRWRAGSAWRPCV